MSIGELADRAGEAAKTVRNAPVIVMGYTGSGADRLRSELSAFGELACTQRTGILPLCHQAVSTWQVVDARGGEGMSPLAASSVRTLCSTLVRAILASEGGRRWCEVTNASAAAARTFARLYPGARFLIAHRRADAVMRAIIGSGGWGLEGLEFAPFVSAHPASPVAALASYWVTHTAQQLEFEQANPGVCYRVRAEDLTENAAQALPDISDFLALDGAHVSPLGWDRQAGTGAPDAAPRLPIDRIPASLLAQVNELHRSLGYSPVTAAGNLPGCPARKEPEHERDQSGIGPYLP